MKKQLITEYMPEFDEGIANMDPQQKAKVDRIFQLAETAHSLAQAAHYMAHNSKKMIKSSRKLHLPVPTEWKNKRFACRLLKKEFTGI